MLEDFINALQNFRRNKTRTFLSLLGVIIGVAAVIVITSMGNSSTKQVQDTFGTSGLDIVSISSGFMRKKRDAVKIVFDESFREKLFDNVRDIKKIWYKNNLSTTLTYGTVSASTSCAAVEYGYLEMYNMELESGSYFSVTDDEQGMQKIILTHDLAENLFPAGDATGQKIMLVADKVTFGFKVCGVLKEQTVGMENSTAFIPRGFYKKKIKPNPAADTVLVQAVSQNKSTELVSTLSAYCKQLTGTESVNVNSMQTMLEQMSSITNTMSVLLAAVAAISLLVGGIGIMNIMIVTVTERRQEIGIRKALGANPRDICQQFLIESASITIIGGVIGVILGIGLSLAVEYIRGMSLVISSNSCVISFAFSVFVGIFFGLNPALRASKLDPVEALSA
ncbi:MAG: ABC transporter permease [Treponema sp.]|uniref:ABC transporter permease n=1 Tax=Treponema sp. TaxID=166 RepID=UPI00298EB594|nr:ABC transporter permease [Treponema sp.]MBR0154580.1 ABC transporter permease [Treponema sp.]MCR5387433.1 ABC transporter permease [Treponema sp.]